MVAGVWQRAEIYAGGRHLGTYSGGAGGVTSFSHTDWLGTERVRTNVSGVVSETCTSNPYGDALSCAGTDVSPIHYTGLERDTETNLDHAWFRYYNSRLGVWMTPDPAGLSAVSSGNPQSWNANAYVTNTPVNESDQLGLIGRWGDVVGTGRRPGIDPVLNPVGAWLASIMQQFAIDAGIDSELRQGLYNYLTDIDGPGASVGEFNFLNQWMDQSGLSDPANNGNPIVVPANPCSRAGKAPDPSVYQAKGQAAQSNAIRDFYYLPQFMRGGALDAQVRYGGSPAYANYAYGVYMSAAGYTLNQALSGADFIAQHFSHYPASTTMDPDHPFTPMVNVMNITYGFNAQQNGTLCHK